MSTLEQAMAIVAAADPAQRLKIEMRRAVSDVDFVAEAARKPPQPGMGGQSPVNSALIEAREAVHREAVERDAQASQRREENLEAAVKILQAGQAPGNLAAIRATVSQGG